MKNFLVDKTKYYIGFADQMYSQFRRMCYGIRSKPLTSEYDISIIRKDLADWQSNADNDALTQTSISYYGWLPINYNSNDESVVFSNNFNDPYKYLKVMSNNPINVGLSYNYGTNQNQNLIDVNTGGCVTRINLNPAITITNTGGASGTQYTFFQSIASSTWTINHNLGFVPNVYTMDEDGVEIIGTIDTSSISQTVIKFTSAVTGYAYLS